MAVRLAYADRWRFFKTRFRLLRNAAFLVGLSALDIRDLWYKLTWVGAYDAFAFTAGSRGTLVPTPLPLKNPLPTPFTHYETEQFSGWPSYLSRCETLAPFCSPGSTFFLNAMGSNCQVGVKGENKTIERLVMTSNVRTDSMAWATCRLLYGHRRPAICQQTIVSRFEERYHFEAMPVESEWLAPVDSAAETELLRFLELIAMSHPRYKVVCTGGLAYTTPGEYKPTIFGCASANVFRAEYAGVYATHFHQLAFNKAWLTDIDVITLADVSYKIRQNTINVFTMEEEQDADGKVVVSITESTMNNFVSTGLLYMLMIIIDMILLLSQMYTGVELVTQWILPVMRQRDPSAFDLEDDASLEPVCAADTKDIYFTQEEYASFLTSSLYRQPVIVFLTVVSQLISWGIIIPNSVVWTWSLSNYSKAMAFASSLRMWTLILIALNIVWDTVVFFFEKKAYAFARATFVSTFEVIAVGVIVAFAHKSEVMAISEAKFGVERQWINDLVSFPSYIAHGNTFNEDLDHVSNSSPGLLKVMYAPLLKIVFHSVLVIFGWLVVKLLIMLLLKTWWVTHGYRQRIVWSAFNKRGAMRKGSMRASTGRWPWTRPILSTSLTTTTAVCRWRRYLVFRCELEAWCGRRYRCRRR